MQKTHDLTSGNIYRHLIQLSVPLIMGNILQQFYNTIDAFVVGRFAGQEEFAAIGIAGTVMNLFLFMIVGACTGLSVLFARFYGTKDYRLLRKQHFTSLVTGLGFTLILSVIGFAGTNSILTILHTPDALFQYTATYLWWIFLSLPAAFLYNMYASALRSSGDTLAALFILAAAVFSNLVLDVLFVAYLGLGIRGAAQATALTQLISAVLCFLYLMHSHREFILRAEDCKLERRSVQTTLQCSLVTSIHQAGLYIGKALIQGVINTGGTEIISAYTAATRIEGFANSFGESTSSATSVLISQNYSAGKTDRTKKTFRCSMILTASLGLICVVILFLCAPASIRLMLGGPHKNALESGVRYLRIIAFFYPFCFTGGSFTGFYNGLTKVLFTLTGTVLHITIRVIITWIAFPYFGLASVALATGIGWIIANVYWGILKIRLKI